MKCSLLCLCLAAASGLQLGGSPTLRRPRALALRMQEEPQGEVPVGIREVPVEGAAAPAADAAGNVYDDVAPPPPRDPLSVRRAPQRPFARCVPRRPARPVPKLTSLASCRGRTR